MYRLVYLFLPILLVGCATTPAGFDRQQSAIINSADGDTSMRVFKITSNSDSLLLRTASEDIKVRPRDPTLQRLADRLYATVTDSASLGLGIAAPQVGILKNMIWVQRLDKPEQDLPWELYINPVIVEYSEERQQYREGCLSIPNRRGTCERAQTVTFTYERLDGSEGRDTVSDLTAVIVQHEVDHLNGILYLDHLLEHQAARP
jgi:peptide deformylase